jgi:hypothetical protein
MRKSRPGCQSTGLERVPITRSARPSLQVPVEPRLYPSPSEQRRRREQWKARLGLTVAALLLFIAAGAMFRFVRPG